MRRSAHSNREQVAMSASQTALPRRHDHPRFVPFTPNCHTHHTISRRCFHPQRPLPAVVRPISRRCFHPQRPPTRSHDLVLPVHGFTSSRLSPSPESTRDQGARALSLIHRRRRTAPPSLAPTRTHSPSLSDSNHPLRGPFRWVEAVSLPTHRFTPQSLGTHPLPTLLPAPPDPFKCRQL